jgi:hypothetical protein
MLIFVLFFTLFYQKILVFLHHQIMDGKSFSFDLFLSAPIFNEYSLHTIASIVTRIASLA